MLAQYSHDVTRLCTHLLRILLHATMTTIRVTPCDGGMCDWW